MKAFRPLYVFVALMALLAPVGTHAATRAIAPSGTPRHDLRLSHSEDGAPVSDTEALLQEAADLWEFAPQPGLSDFCDFYPGRLTSLSQLNGTTSGYRVVQVYIVPLDGVDRGLDRPKFCSNGSQSPSPMDYAYRDWSVWMTRNLAYTGVAPRRLNSLLHGYTHPTNGTRFTYNAAFFIRSSTTQAEWDSLTPTEKFYRVQSDLHDNGFYPDSTYVYSVILGARNLCIRTATNPCDTTIGMGQFNSAGTQYGYSYALEYLRSGGSGRFYNQPFGCANAKGDAILLHELSHNFGAVPAGTSESTSGLHMRNQLKPDVMEVGIRQPFHLESDPSTPTNLNSIRLAFDLGVEQYRDDVLSKNWDQASTPYTSSSPYKHCAF